MTLTRLLEINKQFVKYEDERALSLADRLWRQRGSPSEPKVLCDTLETILGSLTEEGIYYPKILLLRKKQLQRGTWKPRNISPPDQVCPTPIDGSSCLDCRGGGIRYLPSGGGSFCSCEAGEALKNGFGKPR
jgi:hypothetical protein